MPHPLTFTNAPEDIFNDMRHAAYASFVEWPAIKLFTGAVAWVIWTVFPVATHEIFYVLFAAFWLDFFCGVTAALLLGEGLRGRKLAQSFSKAFFYLFSTILVYKTARLVPVVGTHDWGMGWMASVTLIYIIQDIRSAMRNVHRAGILNTKKADKVLSKILDGTPAKD